MLSRPQGGLNTARVRSLAEELVALQKRGSPVVLVTSGAIGAGMDKFGWKTRPTVLSDKQAAAAVGQVVLMEAYEKAFGRLGVTVAQVLLSRSDMEDRERYLNARNTLSALLSRGVLPIINENDTVATEEIQFGDNDSLAALVAAKVGAGKLFLLTDVDGLLSGREQDARLLPEVFQITSEIEALAGAKGGSHKSVGGMSSKLRAAKLAMASGVEVWIASGKRPGVMGEILQGHGVGTRFQARADSLNARQRWIALGRRVKGTLVLDAGAEAAILQNKRSLLPSGIVRVEGTFHAGDTVKLLNGSGVEIARGLTAYSSEEAKKIRGRKSIELERLLGRPCPAEVIHRDNLVLLT